MKRIALLALVVLAVTMVHHIARAARFRSQPLAPRPVAGKQPPRYVSYVAVERLVVRPQDGSSLDDVLAEINAAGRMVVLSVDRDKNEIAVEKAVSYLQRDEDGTRSGFAQ